MQGIQSILGQQSPTKEQNPLEKIAEDEKKTKEPAKSSGDFNEETLINMMMTGENSTGLFNPNVEDIVEEDDKDKVHVDTKETLNIKTGKTTNISKKYQNAIIEDMKKNPDKFKIQTPEGEMTVDEALKKGYNPVTKKFEKSKHRENIDAAMSRLNDQDKQKISELTDPANVGLAPADAEQFGIPSNSPMIKQPAAGPSPEAAVAGGLPGIGAPEQGQPQGAPGMDIASLLGGIK
jgi:hypothetical protein